MGHFNFPQVSAWDSLASETSLEELSCRVFGEFCAFLRFTRRSATLYRSLSHQSFLNVTTNSKIETIKIEKPLEAIASDFPYADERFTYEERKTQLIYLLTDYLFFRPNAKKRDEYKWLNRT